MTTISFVSFEVFHRIPLHVGSDLIVISLPSPCLGVVWSDQTEILCRFGSVKIRLNVIFVVGKDLSDDIGVHVYLYGVVSVKIIVVDLGRTRREFFG